jgi:hypothetical protein
MNSPTLQRDDAEALVRRCAALESENKWLKTIAEYVYEGLRKEAWEEADAYLNGKPSPSCLDSPAQNSDAKEGK